MDKDYLPTDHGTMTKGDIEPSDAQPTGEIINSEIY